MIPEKVTLPSGRILHLQQASTAKCGILRRALFAGAKQVRLDLSQVDVESPMRTQLTIALLWPLVCEALSNREFEDALWSCAQGICTISNLKLEEGLFDSTPGDEWRGDMIPALKEVARINLLPFFAGLNLRWLIPEKTAPSSDQP